MTRVTQNMINMQFMRNLNTNLQRIEDTQVQLTTGRQINKPSDDPVGITYSMRYRGELVANEQYKENIDSAVSWLDQMDTTLNQLNELMQKVRELAVSAINGTNTDNSHGAIASEVQELYDQVVVLSNSQFNGKYIFNGQKTDVRPYDPADPASAVVDTRDINFEIGVGVKIAVNVTGDKIFGNPDDSDNLFTVISNFKTALEERDFESLQKTLGLMDSRFDKVLTIRTDVGAKTNRVDLSMERLKDIELNFTSLKTKVEDADMAEVFTRIKMEESIYQASLSAGARIIQPSLLDFLR